MSFNINEHKKDLLFIPLGGANEIGMNLNLYQLDGKWLLVDCGTGFADEHLPGVDLVLPDTKFLQNFKKDIVGLVLTHAHEDHLGGVGFLLQELSCPVYATTFTANFLKTKLADYRFENKPKIIEVKPSSKFSLEPFEIEMVPLTHSAPEMQALMIRTAKGNIFHTGDWKFDHDPLIGEKNDETLLRKLGDEGVLALVGDSTNVFNRGRSGSEGDLRSSLVEIIANCPKLVVVTTFASNLARLETVIHAARLANRKVALSGRSMHRMLAAAQESGYLNDNVGHIIDERDIGRYKREEVLVMATGCQGEALAATAKMANKNHQHFKLAPGDTVIFSSKIIPGNEKKIFHMFNTFVREGIEVITEHDHFVHVSGHPSVDELKQMYDLIRPEIVIPVHGEPMHIHEYSKLARLWGSKYNVEVENGSVVKLESHDTKIIGRVHNGYLAVDGHFLLDANSNIFKMRRRIRDGGIAMAAVIFNKGGKLACEPILSFPGCLDPVEDRDIMALVKEAIISAVEQVQLSHRNKATEDQVIMVVRNAIRRVFKEECGKNPQAIVEVRYLG